MDHSISIDFSNLLENPEDYNVKIGVGEEPNIKEFKAHSLILSLRSAYFKSALSSRWAKIEDGIIIFNKPNISPLVFEVLMRHIYTGVLSIENSELSLIDVAIAADELQLTELYQQLEDLLLNSKLAWKPKDIIKVCQHDHFTNLYEVALEIVCRNPVPIFESEDFLKMEENPLIQLLICDDLELEEIKICEYLIKWGIENTNSILDNDLTKWTPENFMDLKYTLRNCIPHIRFFQMSSDDYTKATCNLKDILPDGLDDEVLRYFSDPNLRRSFNGLPLRGYPFESKIINAKDATLIANWIDKKRGAPYDIKNFPFKFKLIYRASRDGFGINTFHENCDDKGPTIVVIKVRNSGEIIGGYNPLEWRHIKMEVNERSSLLLSHHLNFYHDYQCKTPNSFIFSLTNQATPILSRVTSKKEAIIWCSNKGPCFGLHDLCINSSRSFNSIVGKSKKHSYEKKIINRETFEIEEYEVFQIIDKRFQPFKRIFQSVKFIKRIIFTFITTFFIKGITLIYLFLFFLLSLLLLPLSYTLPIYLVVKYFIDKSHNVLIDLAAILLANAVGVFMVIASNLIIKRVFNRVNFRVI